MKSKQSFNKRSDKRSTYNEIDEKGGLKPIKSKSGKSNKKISIYDDLDDDFDESELDELDYKNLDLDFDKEYDGNENFDDDEDY